MQFIQGLGLDAVLDELIRTRDGRASAAAAPRGGPKEISVVDLARSLRKNRGLPAHTVIDNDNISQVMEEVESRKLNASSQLFSIDQTGNDFQVSAPDVTCSLSFTSQAAPLLSESIVSQNLPDSELPKLDGPATIEGDVLQVSVFNGSEWNVRELTVGITIVRHENKSAGHYGSDSPGSTKLDLTKPGSARLVTAAATGSMPIEKRSDWTVLYHLKGTAAPLTTTMFREPLGVTLNPDQEWHWAIVQAKGIPPQEPSSGH